VPCYREGPAEAFTRCASGHALPDKLGILGLRDRHFCAAPYRWHVWALCHSARFLTDGFIALEVLRGCSLVTRKYTVDRALRCLIGAGLWEEADGGIRICDYLDYNPDAASVKEKRRQNAERQERWRKAQEGRGNAPSNALPKKRVTHPPTPPLAGKGAAPRGAPLDDCMRCGERRPLNDHDGSLLCDECERAAA
jgi:hypothetical protein